MTPEQIEAATAEQQREVLDVVFATLHDGKSAQWLDHYGCAELSARGRRFRALMGLNAYLDAALMLVPEGLCWGVARDDEGAFIGAVSKPKAPFPDGSSEGAATPALALCAAIAKAEGEA